MCVKARVYVWVSECVRRACLRSCPPPAPAPEGLGRGCAGAFPVADALQADWPPNRIICCGLTPH